MKKSQRILGVAAFCCFVSLTLQAQQATTTQPAAAAVDETTLTIADQTPAAALAAPTSSVFTYILRMVLVLGLVIAAIYGIFAIIKGKSRKPEQEDSFIRVIGSAQLASNKAVHVIALGDKAWLLGTSESSVSLIAELDDKALVEAMVLRAQESPIMPRKDFASILAGILRPKGGADETTRKNQDFFSRQRDRIKKF